VTLIVFGWFVAEKASKGGEIIKRSGKLVIMAHCILNANSKVKGLSLYPGVVGNIVLKYIDAGFGIIQLPCPEITYGGLKRWGKCRDQYDHPKYRRHCRELLEQVVDQIEEYVNNDYEIEGIIGIDGSPSCGVNITCRGYAGGELADTSTVNQLANLRETEGQGIFIEELVNMVSQRNVKCKLLAIDEKGLFEGKLTK